ncbi:MAG: hypothetical protein PUG10_02275 [Lachnospiraceae bacterium]|nr:hypothetical protein [Lachnospiraceae bacterium]
MKDDEYISKLSKSRFHRIFARVCLLILFALIITTVVLCIIGSEYYMPVFLITLMVPIFMYVILWLGKVIGNTGQISDSNNNTDDNED